MNKIAKALSRVCDDAERHLSAGLQGQDIEGWEAINLVREIQQIILLDDDIKAVLEDRIK
jgi:hypothetical protein